jgi:Skp family chaperone for outer membrane proteins
MTIVERFRGADCNFLTSPDRDLTEYSITDITHESLIRRWGRLNGWIEEEAKSGEWYRRIEDRLRLGAEFIVDPELEAALQARRLGGWNEAWSMRYATVPDDQKTGYHAVTRFLDLSAKRRTDEVHRLRRSRRFAAGIACVFAALAGAAAYFGHAAREATKVAEQERKAAQDARNQLVISQAEAEKARLEAEASQAAKRGEQARADRLQRSAEAAQKSLEEVKKAVASRQRDQDLEKVANRYYISPYSNDFSLWYAGTWYRSRSGVSTYDTRKVQR